jgi:hypothetical protein
MKPSNPHLSLFKDQNINQKLVKKEEAVLLISNVDKTTFVAVPVLQEKAS